MSNAFVKKVLISLSALAFGISMTGESVLARGGGPSGGTFVGGGGGFSHGGGGGGFFHGGGGSSQVGGGFHGPISGWTRPSAGIGGALASHPAIGEQFHGLVGPGMDRFAWHAGGWRHEHGRRYWRYGGPVWWSGGPVWWSGVDECAYYVNACTQCVPIYDRWGNQIGTQLENVC